jgi:hypothetical protein
MTPPLNKIVYDTYISYSHSDENIVIKIAERLKNQEGLNVFFDKWAMIPGDPHSKMHDNIYQSKTFIACIGEEQPKTWHREEIDCAIQRVIDDKNFKVMAILLSDKSGENVPPSLKARTWVDLSKGDNEENYKKILSSIEAVKLISMNKYPIENYNPNYPEEMATKKLEFAKKAFDNKLISERVYDRTTEIIFTDYFKSDMFTKDPRDG